MTLGPLEYLVVGFEGNRFTSQILAELQAACEKGIIRVIDLLVLMKDENGNITVAELSDLSGEEAERLGPFAGDLHKVFEPDDVEAAASTLPKNSSAGLLLFEHTWAVGLFKGSDYECGRASSCRRAGCTGSSAGVRGRIRS